METMQCPREGKISHSVLEKMSIQEKNNAINRVAESLESIVDINTKQKPSSARNNQVQIRQ